MVGDITTGEPDDRSAPSNRSMRWPWWIFAGVAAVLIWNAVIFIPVARALSDEEHAVTVAYRQWLVSPDNIVLDVWSVDGALSMVDMDRRFFKAAEALQDKTFDQVALAYRGKTKMLFGGAAFQNIGSTRQTQNPVYTMRTMQEHVSNPDGTPAFGTWTGGLLGVLNKQLDDHKTFHERWWLDDALGR